jgi:hypothetical protein
LQGWGKNSTLYLLCGGPSAPSDLAKAKAQIGSKAYDLAGVNNHGLLFLGELAWCYAHDVRMVQHLQEYETPAIVHHEPKNLRDKDIHGGIVPFIDFQRTRSTLDRRLFWATQKFTFVVSISTRATQILASVGFRQKANKSSGRSTR